MRWETRVPGQTAHRFLCDSRTGSVLVADGWGVSFAALRLHRLDLAPGREQASIRTNYQPVGAMTIAEDVVLVATKSRLLEVDPITLGTVRAWEKVLPQDTHQLVVMSDHVFGANWLKPGAVLFDRKLQTVAKIKAGQQPHLAIHAKQFVAIAGLHGGMADISFKTNSPTNKRTIGPVSEVDFGTDIWAIAGQPVEDVTGQPGVRHCRATSTIVRLTGVARRIETAHTQLSLWVDDTRELLWCLRDDRSTVSAIAQINGQIRAEFVAATHEQIVHVDPHLGLVITSVQQPPKSEGTILRCYALPTNDSQNNEFPSVKS